MVRPTEFARMAWRTISAGHFYPTCRCGCCFLSPLMCPSENLQWRIVEDFGRLGDMGTNQPFATVPSSLREAYLNGMPNF